MRRSLLVLVALAILAASAASAFAATTNDGLTFSNTELTRPLLTHLPEGASEPEIAISSNGTMAIVGLQWLFDPFFFGTHLWTGPFGSTPTFQGLIDAGLQQPGKFVFGSEDADVDLGSNGTLHATTLLALINAGIKTAQIGVTAVRCPNATSSIGACSTQIIDTAGADRAWITSDGLHVYISYHDSGNSSLIHVQRSDDDGLTWQRAGDPIVGQGRVTGNATFNNDQGPLKTDLTNHFLYDIYAEGEAGIQKAKVGAFNNIIVSRSTDMGKTWTPSLVYHAPLFTGLNNVFPSLAVDQVTGNVYAVWSDAANVFFSASSDHGTTWSDAVTVNIPPATIALFPWVAANNGTVDVVYYGSANGTSNNDPSAVWNVYLAQTTDDGASFKQNLASNTSNHTGAICTGGVSCALGTRNLLDLFEVAIDPLNGKAAVIYTDDTLTTFMSAPLPQIVLAQQN